MKTLPTREDLVKELIKPGSIGAEIGVYRGGFSRKILELCKPAKLYCIDAWTQYDDYKKDSLCATNQDDNMQATKHELRQWIAKGECEVIKGFSAAVARRFTTKLDFIFLDSIHTYPYVLEDLREWHDLIKPDGVIMLHDYTDRPAAKAMDFGVIEAVSQFCNEADWELIAITQEGDWPSAAIRRK